MVLPPRPQLVPRSPRGSGRFHLPRHVCPGWREAAKKKKEKHFPFKTAVGRTSWMHPMGRRCLWRTIFVPASSLGKPSFQGARDQRAVRRDAAPDGHPGQRGDPPDRVRGHRQGHGVVRGRLLSLGSRRGPPGHDRGLQRAARPRPFPSDPGGRGRQRAGVRGAARLLDRRPDVRFGAQLFRGQRCRDGQERVGPRLDRRARHPPRLCLRPPRQRLPASAHAH